MIKGSKRDNNRGTGRPSQRIQLIDYAGAADHTAPDDKKLYRDAEEYAALAARAGELSAPAAMAPWTRAYASMLTGRINTEARARTNVVNELLARQQSELAVLQARRVHLDAIVRAEFGLDVAAAPALVATCEPRPRQAQPGEPPVADLPCPSTLPAKEL